LSAAATPTKPAAISVIVIRQDELSDEIRPDQPAGKYTDGRQELALRGSNLAG